MELITTIAGALTAALVLGLLTERIGLSPIVGYLAAGIVVGPFTPGFVAHGEIARELADVGVVLLLFGVGLHFRLKDLAAVWRVVVPGAIAAQLAAVALGWWASGLVFGIAISVTSTVVVMRVLADRGALHGSVGHVAIGWLVVEDLVTVVLLVLLSSTKGGGSPLAAVKAVAGIGAFAALTILVGRRLLPRLLVRVARTRSRELFTLSVLVVALGIAAIAAEAFGASLALGAFIAGVVVGQSSFGARAGSEALPMRDAFAVLFFVSIGMLFDPRQLLANAPLTLTALGIVFVGKPLTAFLLMRLLKRPTPLAAPVAASLANVGEMSFVVGAAGVSLGVLPQSATQVLVAAALVSITLSPVLYDQVVRLAGHATPTTPLPHEGDDSQRAIVIGYGPIGRRLTELLLDNGLVPTVVELNHDTVEALGKRGIRAVYGDATQREILHAAGVEHAGTLVFAASGTPPVDVIQTAKELNPELRIFARSTYASEAVAAQKAGADVVVSAESEVALAMAEHLLVELGATPDQIDQARIHARVQGGPQREAPSARDRVRA